VDFITRVLKPNGAVLIKTSQGAGFQELVETARQSFHRQSFHKVRFANPDAPRSRGSEL
jgi:23S rRNA U2552 (ribose-2'-O)-methylase RlmE/FtsJ